MRWEFVHEDPLKAFTEDSAPHGVKLDFYVIVPRAKRQTTSL